MRAVVLVGLSVFVAIAVSASLARADRDGGGAGADHDETHPEDDAERALHVETSGNEVQIESESRSGSGQADKFQLKAHFEGSSMELRMDRFARSTDSAASFRFRLRPHSIVEYVEADGVAGLTAGDNTNCTKYRILGSTISASQPVVSRPDVNTTLTVVTLTTGDGLFQMVLRVSGSAQTLSRRAVFAGRVITPTSAKFDIVLTPTAQNFAFSCANSQLALLMKVKSKQQTRAHTDTGATVQTAVQLGDAATPLGFFSWAQSVTIGSGAGNTTASVVSSGFSADASTGADAETDLDSRDGEQSQRAYFSFIATRPSKVTWDPEIGYSALSQTSGAAAAVTTQSAALALISAAVALMARAV